MKLFSVSLFAKLYLTLSLASLFIFSGLTFSNLKNTHEAFRQQKAKDMSVFVDSVGQYLDLYLLNIQNVLITVVKNTETLPDMKQTQEDLRYYADLNNSIVSNLYIVYNDDTVIANNQTLYDVIGHPYLKTVYHNALEDPGLIYWSEPYYSPLIVNRTVAFTLCIKDATENIVGVAILEINTPRLTEQLSRLLYNSGQTFVLLNNEGGIISFDPTSDLIAHKAKTNLYEIEDKFAAKLMDLSNGINEFVGSKGPLLSVKSDQNKMGWYLISFTDEKDFKETIQRLYRKVIEIGAVWFLILLVATMLISRNFIIPIRQLALQMDRIRDERMHTSIRIKHRKDEIGKLSTSFYMMLDRIKGLMELQMQNEERKKRLELRLLLSQIRPHFLYNTLACIGSLAKQNRIVEVQETIRSLILLLTFSIDKKQEMIPLEEEITGLHAYIHIQKMRYSDSFEFITEVEDQHLEWIVPKFILQPLVENSIFHGLSDMQNGRITVRSEMKNNLLSLYVTDNGAGIPQHKIDELVCSPYDFEESMAKRKSGFNSIGLKNVQERIKLNFGNEYGLRIRSEIGIGTEIQVVLPYLNCIP